MILPIRCFTCGKVIADKWNKYKELTEEASKKDEKTKFTIDDVTITEDENPMNFGIINQNGTVIGTYLHGFLNNNSLRQELLSYIRLSRNIDNPIKLFNFDQFKQDELDRLCNLLTESIKMNEVSALIAI